MSAKSSLKEDHKSEIAERSEDELLEEKIRNQQTLDSFIESDKNWSWQKLIFLEKVMNLKRSSFAILNKERRKIDYIKEVYKKKSKLKLNFSKIPKMKIREIQFKFKMY
jgi:hypothetical protein